MAKPGSLPQGHVTGPGAHLVLWVAQGFWVGRIPFAPGTWGAGVGMLWAALLLRQGGGVIPWLVTLVSILAAVPVCAAAERILGRSDPGCVVLDELVVMPLVWLPAVWWVPSLTAQHSWILPAAGFAAFRLFDIWKPGPIRSSQELPGGWGVVMDDVLAALLAGLVILGLAAAGVR